MAHVVLNYETAARLGRLFGLHTAEQTADFLGVPIEHVRYVCEHHGYPSDEFIAAALLKLPIRFDELFLIVAKESELVAA